MIKALRLSLFLTAVLILTVLGTSAHAKKDEKNKKQDNKIKVLSLSQLGKLPLNRRAEYVRLMRESMVDFEKFQLDFQTGNKEKTAMIEDAYRRLIEAAFGPQAYAQAAHQQACPHKCIYAFSLQTYATVGGQCVDFPLGCERPATCNIGRSQTKGFVCEQTISGLSGTNACVSQSNTVTKTCYDTMTGLSKNNTKAIDASVAAVADYFGLNVETGGTRKTITREALDPADEQSKKKVADLIERLGTFAYDDKAYAQLIGVIDLYKRAGIAMPTGLSAETQSLVTNITSKYEGVAGTVNRVFQEYRALCDRPLDAPVTAKIRAKFVAGSDPANPTMTDEWRRLPSVQRAVWKRRAVDLIAAEASAQPTNSRAQCPADNIGCDLRITNRSVLQKQECIYVDQRFERLAQRTAAIESTLPIVGDKPTVPPVAGNPTTPPPVAPLPPEVVNPPQPLGCPSSVDSVSDKIFQNGARCAICAAEKAVHNAEQQIPYADASDNVSSRATANGDYRVSRKWTSLVSTMALACGSGRNEDTSLDPIDVTWYMESFGHCSSDVYDWHTSSDSFLRHDQDQVDQALVERWARRNFWRENADDSRRDEDFRPEPDRTFNGDVRPNNKRGRKELGDFVRIYGISYEQATAIFCNPENFDAKVDKRGGYMTKIKRINRNGLRASGSAGSRSEARNRMSEALKNAKIAGGQLENSAADDLLMCLKKSNDLAKRVYPDSAETCMTMQPLQQGLPTLLNDMARPDGRFPGNFISAGSGCYVGDAVQYGGEKKDTQLAIGFKDPGRGRDSLVREFNRGSRARFDESYRMFEQARDGTLRNTNRFESGFDTYQVAVQTRCSNTAGTGTRSRSNQ